MLQYATNRDRVDQNQTCNPSSRIAAVVFAVVVLASASTAGHAQSMKRALKQVGTWPHVNLKSYNTLFIEDFELTDPEAAKRKDQVQLRIAPKRMADTVASMLTTDSWQEVLRANPDERPAAAALSVELKKYKPGSAAARYAFGMGAGKSIIQFLVTIVDTTSGQELVRFEASERLAKGGVQGLVQKVSTLEELVAYELALYLDRTRGRD